MTAYEEKNREIAMRKLLSLFLFSILTVSLSAQIIDETIPKFGEKLLSMNKTSAQKEIVGRGFNLLSTDDMRALGYTNEEIKLYLAGTGNYGITCKIQCNENLKVSKVTITAQYTNIRSMMNECTKEGYELDEEQSTRGDFMYIKVDGKYLYFLQVLSQNTPTFCMATMIMSRIQPDYLK